MFLANKSNELQASNSESFSVSLVSEDLPLMSKLLVFANASCFSWSRRQGHVHVLTDCAWIRSNSIGFTLLHLMCSLRWHVLHSTAWLFLAMVLPQAEHLGGPGFIETSPLRTIRVIWKVDVDFVECFTRDAKNPFLDRWVKLTWCRCNRTAVAESPGILTPIIHGDASSLPVERRLSVIFSMLEKKHVWSSNWSSKSKTDEARVNMLPTVIVVLCVKKSDIPAQLHTSCTPVAHRASQIF